MKVLNEAIVGEYHFVVSNDYLAITLDGKEMVHLSAEEMQEVVPWLMSKVGHTTEPKQFIAKAYPLPDRHGVQIVDRQADTYTGGSVPLEARSAVQKVPMKDTNPFLASQAPNSSSDGKFAVLGVRVDDLAVEAAKAGVPILRK